MPRADPDCTAVFVETIALPRRVTALVTVVLLLMGRAATAEPVSVRHREGLVHGFLVLKSSDGSHLADGDLIQTTHGDRVTSRLVFHFDDGSRYEERAEYSQKGRFRLINDQIVRRGPSFPQPLDMTIDVGSGTVSVRYTDDDGRQQKTSRHMDLPDDLANGMIPVLLKNIEPDRAPEGFGFVAATPDPQLVRLELHPSGEDRFSIGHASRTAIEYVLKVDIGGIKGLLAGLLGKQPPDSHVWILGGDAPAFLRADQPLYAGGPLWRIELASPVWDDEK